MYVGCLRKISSQFGLVGWFFAHGNYGQLHWISSAGCFIKIRLSFRGLWHRKFKRKFKCRECFRILLSSAFQCTLKLCDYHKKWQWKLSLKRPTHLWKIHLDQKVITDPNPLWTQLSQLTMVQIQISQCPSNKEFPKFFKTHPAFVCSSLLKASRSLWTLTSVFLGHPAQIFTFVWCFFFHSSSGWVESLTSCPCTTLSAFQLVIWYCINIQNKTRLEV